MVDLETASRMNASSIEGGEGVVMSSVCEVRVGLEWIFVAPSSTVEGVMVRPSVAPDMVAVFWGCLAVWLAFGEVWVD